MIKILVTGKNGQLGSSLQELSTEFLNLEFVFKDSKELDIADRNTVEKILYHDRPDVVINCAAYTLVDLAEEKTDRADLVNHIGVENLATICLELGIGLIHISTDYVFNGEKREPYEIADPTDPINIYGISKLAGEQAMQRIGPKGAIIRTSWVYSRYGSNFVKTMLRLGGERDVLNVVDDQFGSPTNALDLARACLYLVQNMEEWDTSTKVYHYSNQGIISWYEFAKEIMKLSGLTCRINPVSSAEYKTKAKRPSYSVLKYNMDKSLQKDYRESLQNFLNSIDIK
jgi:dTDP-4-dehydrorhamnose reductase